MLLWRSEVYKGGQEPEDLSSSDVYLIYWQSAVICIAIAYIYEVINTLTKATKNQRLKTDIILTA
ncbi:MULTISPECIES: hypothetical protein [Cyanophyceae]|uniref:hypothetical protein n=1 Tax=Cyanophyceae TaxID=3028117 RepID=UPI00232F1B9D|nr:MULTISPECIES: hypothetical protein [Cyanophyceae]MDB9320450.1 hypothetical protein [Nodularia spumigena CS-591/07A]MDB9331860.1 hypothetical protein [Nodularia spumigena CS-591/04]MDB9351395.1 hypothetical protein [Nodularia spumigena CS-588/05]MDB9307022.1 hypothetical protein [Nodularia spumigena CS-591/12]MDB9316201.1 hypothetical protein [Nodularia spumigena CS-590/01A]